MTELETLRAQIDKIDEKIIEQLISRIEVVKKVGEYKKENASPPCPIRPAREANMLRRITEAFRPTDFPASAAAAIWRIIIGASTSVEADMTLSVFASEQENNLYWLAREYFGTSAPIIKQAHVKRVIGDVLDGKAAVGVVPFLRGGDVGDWWVSLLQQGEHTPKIFAHVPFVYTDIAGKNIPSALAIARLLPEPSGDDMSIVVIETDSNVSQHRLQTAFVNEKLEATWINIASLSASSRHHLLEVKGFITHEHAGFANILAALGASIISVNYLGVYATPITIANSQNT